MCEKEPIRIRTRADVDEKLRGVKWEQSKKRPITVWTFEAPIEMIIETLEGDMRAHQGWRVIEGIRGELYPCAPEIYQKTYDPVGDEEKQPQGVYPSAEDINERVRTEAHNQLRVAVVGLIEENRKLREERGNLRSNLDWERKRKRKLRVELTECQALLKEQSDLKQELEDLQARIRRQADINLSERDCLNKKLAECEHDRDNLQETIEECEHERDWLRTENEKLETKHLSDLIECQSDVETAEYARRLVVEKNEKLSVHRDELAGRNVELFTKNEQLQRDLDTAKDLQGVIRGLSSEKRDLITENEKLSAELKATEQLRQDAVACGEGEEAEIAKLRAENKDLRNPSLSVNAHLQADNEGLRREVRELELRLEGTPNEKLKAANEKLSLQIRAAEISLRDVVVSLDDEAALRQRLLSALRDLVEGAEK